MSGSCRMNGQGHSPKVSHVPSHQEASVSHPAWGRLFAAWIIALAATAGALFIGPDLEKAWDLAGAAGLDVQCAKAEASSPEIDRVLEQDVADVKANNVRQTPTFFVNGKLLTTFDPQQLANLVLSEVERVRKGL